MVILDIDSMIPKNHLLRRIKNCVNFDFIYEKAPSGEGAFYTYSFLFPAELTPPESLR